MKDPRSRVGDLVALTVLLVSLLIGLSPSGTATAAADRSPANPTIPAKTDGAVASTTSPLQSPPPVISTSAFASYLGSAADAWEQYTTEAGVVLDPLLAPGSPPDTDGSSRFGIIMMADAMLKASAIDGDSQLALTAERILASTTSLPVLDDPFNLIALASLIKDGEHGEFPAEAWSQIARPVMTLAAQITLPSTSGKLCYEIPTCYNNWRLIWDAGASILLNDDLPSYVPVAPATLAGDPSSTTAQIETNLAMALSNVGPVDTTSNGLSIAEMSDPGEEPLSYQVLSTLMLNIVAEEDPTVMTPALTKLSERAEDYTLDLMSPDGQLSFAGRSLDQSWVQAAGATLGASLAAKHDSSTWSAFANRALTYLMTSFHTRPDGTIPIVPGLLEEWNPEIVDYYAQYNQYAGMTLWLLSDALEAWSPTIARLEPASASTPQPEATIPSDHHLFVDDLASSGLIWGRHGRVWWMISGRATAGDPRSDQGLVAVKVRKDGSWEDLIALRPMASGFSSAWLLTYHGHRLFPVFTQATGDSHEVILKGRYGITATTSLPATWRLVTTRDGVKLTLTVPGFGRTTVPIKHHKHKQVTTEKHYLVHATLWTTKFSERPFRSNVKKIRGGRCLVTASGLTCPRTMYWSGDHDTVTVAP